MLPRFTRRGLAWCLSQVTESVGGYWQGEGRGLDQEAQAIHLDPTSKSAKQVLRRTQRLKSESKANLTPLPAATWELGRITNANGMFLVNWVFSLRFSHINSIDINLFSAIGVPPPSPPIYFSGCRRSTSLHVYVC